LTQVSNELLEDSAVNLTSLMATQVGNALGHAVNTALTVGTGTDEPVGVVDAAGSGVTGTATTGVFTYSDLVELIYSTDAAARALPGFSVMASTSAIVDMRTLQDGAGNFVFSPTLDAATADRVLGYPLVENPAMAASAHRPSRSSQGICRPTSCGKLAGFVWIVRTTSPSLMVS